MYLVVNKLKNGIKRHTAQPQLTSNTIKSIHVLTKRFNRLLKVLHIAFKADLGTDGVLLEVVLKSRATVLYFKGA